MIFAPEQARDLLYSTVADMTNDPADGEDYMYIICPPNMFSTIRKALHITMRVIKRFADLKHIECVCI
jgi:hypothetical protein